METWPAIRERRSVRSFAGGAISDDDIERLLDAGRWAPSGLNNQPWRFLVLNGGLKDGIAEYTKYGAIIKACDTCIVVFVDEASCYDRTKDMQAIGACIQNILLEAHDIGLGGVWLGEILNRHKEVEKYLGIDLELMAIIALGIPDEGPKTGKRREITELLLKSEEK